MSRGSFLLHSKRVLCEGLVMQVWWNVKFGHYPINRQDFTKHGRKPQGSFPNKPAVVLADTGWLMEKLKLQLGNESQIDSENVSEPRQNR